MFSIGNYHLSWKIPRVVFSCANLRFKDTPYNCFIGKTRVKPFLATGIGTRTRQSGTVGPLKKPTTCQDVGRATHFALMEWGRYPSIPGGVIRATMLRTGQTIGEWPNGRPGHHRQDRAVRPGSAFRASAGRGARRGGTAQARR